jgi:hypothetical protein
VKDENGDLLADSQNILNRWKNYFSQLLNVHRISDVRQIEIHTAEPLVPDPSPFEIEIAIANLKKYESPGSDQIATEVNITYISWPGQALVQKDVTDDCPIKQLGLSSITIICFMKCSRNNYKIISCHHQ